jgi:single-strand DNA-binding protein
MLNKAAIMGRMVADPELRHTSEGISVCSFTLAVQRSFVKRGQERQVDFIDIVAWRNTAEFVCTPNYFSKGSLMAVDGSIQTRTYEDKNGNKRKAVEIVADNVHFAESKKSDANFEKNDTGFPAPPGYAAGNDNEFKTEESDDDLPF